MAGIAKGDIVRHQIYMWSGAREYFISRLEFYVDEIENRVLSNFRGIEDESAKLADAEYEKYGRSFSFDSGDMADAADFSHSTALDYYLRLFDLRKQAILGALAGCYHLWDKDLRRFLDKELSHSVHDADIYNKVWKPSINNVFSIISSFGWECKNEAFYTLLEAARLIVNVYKHGNGPAFSDLKTLYPQYLAGDLCGHLGTLSAEAIDYEYLAVSEHQYIEIVEAMKSFWQRFPERLFLNIGE